MIEVFKYLHGFCQVQRTELTLASGRALRGHSLKLQKNRHQLDLRGNYFTHRVVSTWNSLPEEVVMAPSINVFKSRPDHHWMHLSILLNGDQWGRYHNGVNRGESSLAYKKDVSSFNNPFFLRLSSENVSSLAKGVWVTVSCLEPCELHVYWGAAISRVHAALLKSGTDLLEDICTNALWDSYSLATERHRLQTEGKHSIHLTVPEEIDAEKLGPPPRQRYPCILVMAATSGSSVAEHTSVVAVVSVLHLKDSQCAMETHIIAQYAKMAGLAVYNLQPLFFASEPDEDGDNPNTQQNDMTSSQPSENVPGTFSTRAEEPSESLSRPNTLTANGDSDIRQRSDIQSSPPLHACDMTGDEGQEPLTASGSGHGEGGVHEMYCQRQDSAWEAVLPECIVCQNRPLNCALLPCRHTCVCQVCFQKLDRCPMCRSHIESYFTLCEDDEDTELNSSADELVPLDIYSRFERFNQRLNNFFGFE